MEAILLHIMGIKKEAANNEVLFNDLKTKLIDEKNKKEAEDKLVKGIPEFWLTVLKNAFKKVGITSLKEGDEPILTKLQEITVTYNESPMGYTLHFYFEPNDYFSNEVLTKEYEMKCEPSEHNPLSFDGPEMLDIKGIKGIKGTKINWKEPLLRKEVKKASFFDFFDPPQLPDQDPKADVDLITRDLLLARHGVLIGIDFGLGQYLHETIIPRAVLFFTGYKKKIYRLGLTSLFRDRGFKPAQLKNKKKIYPTRPKITGQEEEGEDDSTSE